MKHTLFPIVALLMLAGCMPAQEIEPQFPGGTEALYKFIDSNLRYPQEALEYHIEGRVYISFVIDVNGYAHDAKIRSGLPGGCGQAALDIVKRMPLWKPGGVRYSDGRTEIKPVQYLLPVNFTLNPQSPRRTCNYSQDTADIHYPGGTDALYRYLAANIDYPRQYWNTKVRARVSFDSVGRVDTVIVDTYHHQDTQAINHSLIQAIHKAFISMPQWQPGTQTFKQSSNQTFNHSNNQTFKQSNIQTITVPIDMRLLASMHDTLICPSYFKTTDRIWQDIIANEAYFRQLLSVNDSLVAGYSVPAKRLQDLAPRDISHYNTLCGVDYYTRSGYGLMTLMVMGDLAVADSLDLMEHFVHLFNWCDGYVAETVFDYGVRIEQRHPEKFRRLMLEIAPDQWEAFLQWRDMLLEWVTPH